MIKIRKAVFPVAGLGTRFLPATKAMPKELLPIVNKPLIQYAVEEAISAGIDTLIFVTGRHKRAIEDHFSRNPEMELALIAKGKHEQADMLSKILPKGVECIFIQQHEQLGLGHALMCAAPEVGDDAFAVLLADDFLPCKGQSVTSELMRAYVKSGKTQLSVMKVSGPSISKYGVVTINKTSNLITGIVEKPCFEEAPSNLASIGRYILTPDIFDILSNQTSGHAGEIQLTDAINTQAAEGNVEAVSLTGERFDCGSVQGYLDAIMFAAKQSHE